METKLKSVAKENKLIIKMCHICGHLNETISEAQRCGKCQKAFLPSSYFLKIQEMGQNTPYKELFSQSQQLHEEDLIKGIYVLW